MERKPLRISAMSLDELNFVLGRIEDQLRETARLKGAAGGQTLSGGNKAGDELTLEGSSDSSKGWVGVKDPGGMQIHGFK